MKNTKRTYTFKPFEELEFSDDFMFKKVMQNSEICIGVIERLLKIKVDHIEYTELQKEIAPYYTSRGVRLDVYVKDSDRNFDIEMQTSKFESIGKRMRYYQSMLDIDDLMKGADYRELKESFVIFICKNSPIEDFDLPVYTFKNTCLENKEVELGDKSHKLIYNASAYEDEKDEELKAFLRFVSSGSAEDKFTDKIKALIEQAKQAESNKTEYMGMNLHDRDIRWAAKREGREEGAFEKAIETARRLIASKTGTLEQIASWVNLSTEQLKDALELDTTPALSPQS